MAALLGIAYKRLNSDTKRPLNILVTSSLQPWSVRLKVQETDPDYRAATSTVISQSTKSAHAVAKLSVTDAAGTAVTAGRL